MITPTVTDDSPAPWYDRASDRFNAILIKESRQALKSRQFVATFMMLLAVSWVVSVFLLLNSGIALEFGAMGVTFFNGFYAVLGFAAFVIVPFVAFRSLVSERDFSTFDLLSITVLKPRQIVWGKLFSAGLQLFLIYSAITPFIAFASLMQGFNTAVSAVFLIGTMFFSLLLSMWALMLATFAKNRPMQTLITASLFMGLMFSYFTSIERILNTTRFLTISFSDPFFWWATAFVSIAGVSYFVLFQQIAISQLTFEADNRSTGIRIICVVHFWLLWGLFAVFHLAVGIAPIDYALLAFTFYSAVHIGVGGLFFSTESDALSRRVRRGIPGRKFFRLLAAPFLPGGARGYLLSLGHLLALWIIVVFTQGLEAVRQGTMTAGDYALALLDIQSPAWTTTLRIATAVCGYAAIYLGIATAIGRWGMSISNDVRPVHVRIFAVLIASCGLIFPMMLRATETIKGFDYVVYEMTNPGSTVWYLMRKSVAGTYEFDWSAPIASTNTLVAKRGFVDVIIVVLALMTLVTVLINSRALLRGLTRLKPLSRSATPTDSDDDGHSV